MIGGLDAGQRSNAGFDTAGYGDARIGRCGGIAPPATRSAIAEHTYYWHVGKSRQNASGLFKAGLRRLSAQAFWPGRTAGIAGRSFTRAAIITRGPACELYPGKS